MPIKTYPILCRAGKMDNYSYLIIDEETNISAIIDPSEAKPIIAKCKELDIKPNYIFNTHHHFDHTDANAEIKQKYQAAVVGNGNDKHRIPELDKGILPNQSFYLGKSEAKIIDVSAHTQGHILYYFADSKAVFTGDTLFNLCIGGIFEGTAEQMFSSLQKIKSLPDDTLFYPGHEYTIHGAAEAFQHNHGNQDIQNYLSKAKENLDKGLPAGGFTIGEEKLCNPYLQAQTLQDFKDLF